MNALDRGPPLVRAAQHREGRVFGVELGPFVEPTVVAEVAIQGQRAPDALLVAHRRNGTVCVRREGVLHTMANILEFLRMLLTTEDEQRRFTANPQQYLAVHEFDHLSGEDVAEAIPVLMQSLPRELTDLLAPYDDEDGDHEITPVRPLVGETDADAAIRQLTFATSLVTGVPFDGADLPKWPTTTRRPSPTWPSSTRPRRTTTPPTRNQKATGKRC